MRRFAIVAGLLAFAAVSCVTTGGEVEAPPAAPVELIIEAEDFQPDKGEWQARPWGTNYYAATFANCFLSRKAYLGAPEQAMMSTAILDVDIPADGDYILLCRYEVVYKFQTQFNIQITQGGRKVFDRTYGSLDNEKLWAFRRGLQKMVRWGWGPVENICWEGFGKDPADDYTAKLRAGKARITISCGRQPEPAARRNVDVLLLTNDIDAVRNEALVTGARYLPLDGHLTQEGDLFVKVANAAGSPLPVMLSSGPCTQHSPYWIHLRKWKAKLIGADGEGADRKNDADWLQPGQESPWVEVGSLLDALNDSGWGVSLVTNSDLPANEQPDLKYTISFASPDKNGKLSVIRTFTDAGRSLRLSAPGDIRSRRELLTFDEISDKMVAYLDGLPKNGRVPDKFLFYPGGSEIEVALGMNAHDNKDSKGNVSPEMYTDLRSQSLEEIIEWCAARKEDGTADLYRIISMGDEIGIGNAGAGQHEQFRQYLRQQNVKPGDVVPGAAAWDQISVDAASKNPRLRYYSLKFMGIGGRDAYKQKTDVLRNALPNALVGANYSPHVFFWPHVSQWVNVFREEAMTLPWTEGYMWQIPVTSQQLIGYIFDAFRCANRGSDRRIFAYVMPHSPGNTPNSFRRCFYMDIAHGATIFSYFTPIPTTLGYTENHVSENDLAMWKQMHDVIQESGLFEDIVFDGEVRPAEVAILLSESSEMWHRSMLYNVEKQHIWMALKHRQLPVDFLIEDDIADGALKDYKALYICDPCVSTPASKVIAEWVKGGGHVMATLNAATRNEFNEPNAILLDLFGVEPGPIELDDKEVLAEQFGLAPDNVSLDTISFWGKADLPWLKPMDRVLPGSKDEAMPVLLARQDCRPTEVGRSVPFEHGGDAFVRRNVGAGGTLYCGFFPGMAYTRPAIPLRPCDRGNSDDAFAHFIPTRFAIGNADALIQSPAAVAQVVPPINCSNDLVESSWIESDAGIAVPLINWQPDPVPELTVRIRNVERPIGKVSSALGKVLRWERDGKDIVVRMPLEVADLLMLRP